MTSKWWISSPTPVDTAEDPIERTKYWCWGSSNASGLTFAFCSTFPLVATMATGLGFSADAELMGEAASVLLQLFNSWDVVAAVVAVEEDAGDDVWGAGEAAALL